MFFKRVNGKCQIRVFCQRIYFYKTLLKTFIAITLLTAAAPAAVTMQVDTLTFTSSTAVHKNLDDFIYGAHLHTGYGVVNACIMEGDPTRLYTRESLAEALADVGMDAIRTWVGYYWNPRCRLANGGWEHYYVLGKFENKWYNPVQHDQNTMNGVDLMDFCQEYDLPLSITADTWYYDPVTHQVYTTSDVIDDIDGVLDDAAFRNAGLLARWYRQGGYTFPFTIEIGNEGMTYGNAGGDPPNPTPQDYATLVAAFSDAIKAEDPNVLVAVIVQGNNADWIHTGSQWDSSFSEQMFDYLNTNFPDTEIDGSIVHFYYYSAPANNTIRTVETINYSLGRQQEDCNYGGYPDATSWITEYNYNTRQSHNYSTALHQTIREIAMIAHPFTQALHIHNIPNLVSTDLSMKTWDNPDVHYWSIWTPDGRPLDEHPEYGPRWRIHTDGLMHKMMSDATKGDCNVMDVYYDSVSGDTNLAAMVLKANDAIRLVIVNRLSSSVDIDISALGIMVSASQITCTGPDYLTSELQQSWSRQDIVPASQMTLPGESVTLIYLKEKLPADFNVDEIVNLEDLFFFIGFYMKCTNPNDLNCQEYP